MKSVTVKLISLALLLGPLDATAARAENHTGAAKEWSKSGFGSSKKFKCLKPSCGGKKSVVSFDRFGGVSQVPELGIAGGSTLEAEFRRRADVRRTMGAVLKQIVKETGNKGSNISTSYFATDQNVGFNISGYDANDKIHIFGKMIVSDNAVVLIGSQAESPALARRNYNSVAPSLMIN
jgi:hypothetical protein